MVEKNMSEDRVLPNDEIDFKEMISALWDGKWLVLSVVAVAVAVSCLYLYQLPKNFSASIRLRPIPLHEEKKYAFTAGNATVGNAPAGNATVGNAPAGNATAGNATAGDVAAGNTTTGDVTAGNATASDVTAGNATASDVFFPINAKILFRRYVETLQDRSFWRESADNVYAAKKSQFTSLEEYNDFLDGIAASFNLVLQVKKADNNSTFDAFVSQKTMEYYPEIKFDGDDQTLYTHMLPNALIAASARVQEDLVYEFNMKVKLTEKQWASAINDLEMKLQNAYSAYKKDSIAKVEMLETKLQNAYSDYERGTNDRIAYLKEQGSIARKLGIRKNTRGVQTFNSDGSVVVNIKGDPPFFLRGFEVIEEEIRLLEIRTNKGAFVEGLLGIEQQIRAIKQDQILLGTKSVDSNIEQQIRAIKQDLTLERAKFFFDNTPLGSDNGVFKAAVVAMNELQVRYKDNAGVVIGVSVFLGLVVGVFALLVRNVIRQ